MLFTVSKSIVTHHFYVVHSSNCNGMYGQNETLTSCKVLIFPLLFFLSFIHFFFFNFISSFENNSFNLLINCFYSVFVFKTRKITRTKNTLFKYSYYISLQFLFLSNLSLSQHSNERFWFGFVSLLLFFFLKNLIQLIKILCICCVI